MWGDQKVSANPIVHPDALWSIASIARWADYTVSAVKQDIITQPNFPKPKRYAGNANPRYLAREVMAFFDVTPSTSSPDPMLNLDSKAANS